MLPDLKLVKETEKFQFTQMTKGGLLLGQHDDIRARVVYKLKTKVKFNKVIKWFVLLLDQSCQSI